MSTTQTPTQEQPQLPNPNDAYQHLHDNIHARVFFDKLAHAGVPVKNAQEASDLLNLAGKLRMVEQNPAIKQASNYGGVNDALDNWLEAQGFDNGTKQALAHEKEAKYANVAAQLAQDPTIYNSVLSLKVAQAISMSNIPQQPAAQA